MSKYLSTVKSLKYHLQVAPQYGFTSRWLRSKVSSSLSYSDFLSDKGDVHGYADRHYPRPSDQQMDDRARIQKCPQLEIHESIFNKKRSPSLGIKENGGAKGKESGSRC